MKTFDKIVLSETEPMTSALWIRDAEPQVKKSPENVTLSNAGKSIWWFTPWGWKKLFDFDTRYSFNYEFNYEGSETPFDGESEYNEKIGIVDNNYTYSLYDGSRDIADNANLVTEKGLKKHIDEINEEFEDLKERVTTNENSIETINETIEKLGTNLETLTEIVSTMGNKIETLENNYKTQQNVIEYLVSRVAALEGK